MSPYRARALYIGLWHVHTQLLRADQKKTSPLSLGPEVPATTVTLSIFRRKLRGLFGVNRTGGAKDGQVESALLTVNDCIALRALLFGYLGKYFPVLILVPGAEKRSNGDSGWTDHPGKDQDATDDGDERQDWDNARKTATN
jgi:hypothetical protein